MKSVSLLFPGQGSQYVGMGLSFWQSKTGISLITEAEAAIDVHLKKLMLEGPPDALTATKIAQPAILLHSYAAYLALGDAMALDITSAIGHSLGEYSALVAAGTISFVDGIKIVHERGRLMASAAPADGGAMAAVLGLNAEAIAEALTPLADPQDLDYAVCANFNSPEQIVIAGTKTGVAKAADLLKAAGAKRVLPLNVSAPFHCQLMAPVQEKIEPLFQKLEFKDPAFPIVSNVTAQPSTSGKEIKRLLLAQIVSPVRFTECVNNARAANKLGDMSIELGPKNVLSALMRKIVPGHAVMNVDEAKDVSLITG
jgi:[acyl-carrier-protein] S-malonyltransferase